MNVFVTLLRRYLIETRWSLGLSSLALFILTLLTTYRVKRMENIIASGQFGPEMEGLGALKLFGGPNMDFSTTALMVCWWNHPIVILTILAWAITRGAAAISGEIERGTMDLTLSRPIARWEYLTSQIVFAVLGLMTLIGFLIAGSLFSGQVYALKNPPTFLVLLKPGLIVLTMGMSVFGYTLPFSCYDIARWRPALIGSAITLVGLFSMSLAGLYKGYSFHDLMQRISVFWAYAPVTVALKGEPLAYNASVLTLVFSVGVAISVVIFANRDIP